MHVVRLATDWPAAANVFSRSLALAPPLPARRPGMTSPLRRRGLVGRAGRQATPSPPPRARNTGSVATRHRSRFPPRLPCLCQWIVLARRRAVSFSLPLPAPRFTPGPFLGRHSFAASYQYSFSISRVVIVIIVTLVEPVSGSPSPYPRAPVAVARRELRYIHCFSI